MHFYHPPIASNGWIFYLHMSIALLNKVKYIKLLINELKKHALTCVYKNDSLIVSSEFKTIKLCFESPGSSADLSIPIDYVVTQHEKIISVVLSKLNLNIRVFARHCVIKEITKKIAEDFFSKWHFFDATTSSYNYGLFHKSELIGAASFSKGRKMNRLPDGTQSFELIRFGCKSGITITGGLSKIINHFCMEKKAGDVMTYVDKQLTNGDSFVRAGFKKHSETDPIYFLINKMSYARTKVDKEEKFDAKKFYLTKNSGNIKLVFTPK